MSWTEIKLKWLMWKVRLHSLLRREDKAIQPPLGSNAKRTVIKLLYYLGLALFLFTLPFVMLVRGAVFVHDSFFLHPWLSILLSVVLTAGLIFVYLSFFYGFINGTVGDGRLMKQRLVLALLVVAAYSLHGLVFLSDVNVKQVELKREFNQLHPVLRLGVSTLVFLDKDLLLTDASRIKEDYRRMGLPAKSRSLHFIQRNGYAHAVDIRTLRRGWIRNQLIRLYFWLMGFNTLRHVGTADHLHVSLSSHDHPGGI